jgi:hypothetical protein
MKTCSWKNDLKRQGPMITRQKGDILLFSFWVSFHPTHTESQTAGLLVLPAGIYEQAVVKPKAGQLRYASSIYPASS